MMLIKVELLPFLHLIFKNRYSVKVIKCVESETILSLYVIVEILYTSCMIQHASLYIFSCAFNYSRLSSPF